MASRRPRDLVFTLFGEYLLRRGTGVWVGSLIALLEPFGLSQGAVRTTLSRMAAKGWLQATREGRHAYYALTPRGRALLEEGQERIFHTTWDRAWSGDWLLLAYSIPEGSRHLRDRLRDRLGWLGFGPLGRGLWISPHDVAERVRLVAADLGIGEHVECFRSTRVGDGPVAELVRKCWDLPGLNRKYDAFVEEWSPELERVRAQARSGSRDARLCYAARFALIHEYRAFLLEDPYLPRQLLPEHWRGDAAAHVFHETHELLAGPADDYVSEVLAAAPEHAGGSGRSR